MPVPTVSRLARRLAVAFAFGLLLAFVPVPGMKFVTESVGAATALPATEPMTPEDLAAAQAAADEPLGTDRVVGSDAAVPEFTAIGFTFDQPPTEPVMVRVKDAAGDFGAWHELSTEDDEGPDRGSQEVGRSGTAPLWVGSATAYEVSLGAGDSASADVVTVHDEQRRTTVEATPLAGATVPPPFGITPRSSWGARAATSTSYGSTVKLAVVHHSVSSNTYSPGEVPGVLRSIQAFHMDGRGWSDIAYNVVVDKYGGIWEGRGGGVDRPVIGAHAMGFNTNSVGVMVIGDYTLTGPTGASLESVSKVIGWKLAIHGVDPSGRVDFTSLGSTSIPAGVTVNLPRVVGHQDVGSTSCPGSIQASLGSIRARAQEWKNFVIAISTPVGNLEVLTGGPNSVTASGWAQDPTSSDPVTIRLSSGGVTVEAPTQVPRPDVVAVHPTYNANTGFAVTAPGVPPGYQWACVSAIDTDFGTDASLGCRRVMVSDPTGTSPVGNFSAATGFAGGFRVAGWSHDVDGPAPRTITVHVEGRALAQVASAADGTFDVTVRGVLAGRREVCFDVVNGGAGVSVTASCVAVDVGGASPVGNVDGFVRNGNYAAISGWAYDPESNDPLPVNIVFDGTRVWRAANGRPRPDVAAARGMGANGGFLQEIYAMPAGEHTVCAVALNVGGGADQNIGCRRFIVK